MDWRQYIHSVPDILKGKPTIKGTRLPVDFVLELLADEWSEQQILENYQGLTLEALEAVRAFGNDKLPE